MDRAGERSVISSGPATIVVSALEDDDFGDFESASTPSNAPAPQLLLDLSGYDPGAIFKLTPTSTFRRKYIRARTHAALPACPHTQGQTLHLPRFLSPFIKPVST